MDEVDPLADLDAAIAGVTLITGTEPPVRDADHLGDDPFFALRASADLLVTALRTPGITARTYQLPFGEVPGAALAGIRITEFLGHGWDLARATGQAPDFPDGIAARGLTQARSQLGSRSPGRSFAPERPAPDGAAAIDRLAAFLGRAV